MDRILRELLEIHSRVSHAAARASSTSELLHEVVREGAELVGVERCGVYMRDESDELFRARAACARGVALAEDVRRWRAGTPGDGLTSEALATREPVIVPDAPGDPRMIEAAVARWRIRSIMAVPMVFDDEVLGLLLMDDIGRHREFKVSDAEIASAFADFAAATVTQTEERLDLRSRLSVASRQLNAVRRAADLDEKLGNLVREGRSLDEITGKLAELLGKPCAVYRGDGPRVAVGSPDRGDGAPPTELLAPDLLAHPEVDLALAENEPGRTFLLGPISSARLRRRQVVAPIMVGGEVWGRLIVTEHKTRISGTDIGTVRRAATLIALRVGAELRAEEERGSALAALTADLLRGSVSPDDAQLRAARVGLALDAKRVVAVFAPSAPSEGAEPDPALLAAACEEHLPGTRVLTAAVSGAAAALIEIAPAEDAAAFLERHRESLEAIRAQLRGDGGPIAAVSDAHRWTDGYRSAHREARQVLECMRRFSAGEGPRLLAARDLGAGGLLLSSSDGEAMGRFADETVGRLLEEGAGAELLPTLRAFFDNMCSVRASAAAIDVHENTIRNRLARVEEQTGLAVVRDPDAQVGARLALLVLILRGRLPVSAPSAPPSGHA